MNRRRQNETNGREGIIIEQDYIIYLTSATCTVSTPKSKSLSRRTYNIQKSQTCFPPRRRTKTKRWHYLPTYLPPTTKEKKSQSIVASPTLPLTLPYTTVQGKGKKKKPVVPDKRNFPFPLLRIERRLREPLSLSFLFFSFLLFHFSFFSLAISANDVYLPESDI